MEGKLWAIQKSENLDTASNVIGFIQKIAGLQFKIIWNVAGIIKTALIVCTSKEKLVVSVLNDNQI